MQPGFFFLMEQLNLVQIDNFIAQIIQTGALARCIADNDHSHRVRAEVSVCKICDVFQCHVLDKGHILRSKICRLGIAANTLNELEFVIERFRLKRLTPHERVFSCSQFCVGHIATMFTQDVINDLKALFRGVGANRGADHE